MGVDKVIERREGERRALIARANAFVRGIPSNVSLLGAAVFGSVARGDFNLWSDIDVLIIARSLPERWTARLTLLGDAPAGISPVAWTNDEWRMRLARGDPIALEARDCGVWLHGSADLLVGS